MEWIDISTDSHALIPAPPEFVWRFLVEPSLMAESRKHVVVAVTAVGEPGDEGHVFFTEASAENGDTRLYKTKVLKAELHATWATLTEIFAWSSREYTSLTPIHGGTWTEARFHGMYRELIREDVPKKIAEYRNFRVAQMAELESAAADFFAAAVAAAHDADGGSSVS